MQVMVENDLKSIAFSNISTGVYGYPRYKAGHIALDTIRKWLEKQPDLDKLDRIIFCVFEDENKDVYETLFPLYFPPSTGEEEEEMEQKKLKSKIEGENKDKEEEKEVGKDKQETAHMTSTTEATNTTDVTLTTGSTEKAEDEKVKEKEDEKNVKQDETVNVAITTEQTGGESTEKSVQQDEKEKEKEKRRRRK